MTKYSKELRFQVVIEIKRGESIRGAARKVKQHPIGHRCSNGLSYSQAASDWVYQMTAPIFLGLLLFFLLIRNFSFVP